MLETNEIKGTTVPTKKFYKICSSYLFSTLKNVLTVLSFGRVINNLVLLLCFHCNNFGLFNEFKDTLEVLILN